MCLQEAQGVYEILEQIADARGWESISTCHEGVTTFYNPAVFDLVEDSVQRIWPNASASNAKWRRLVCSTFRPRSDSDDHQLPGLFVGCNNHTHDDGSGERKAGEKDPETFKQQHLRLCFSAAFNHANAVGKKYSQDAVPILVGDP